jgi:hypothetical protein
MLIIMTSSRGPLSASSSPAPSVSWGNSQESSQSNTGDGNLTGYVNASPVESLYLTRRKEDSPNNVDEVRSSVQQYQRVRVPDSTPDELEGAVLLVEDHGRTRECQLQQLRYCWLSILIYNVQNIPDSVRTKVSCFAFEMF